MLLSVYKAHAHLFKGGLENFLQQVEQTVQSAEELVESGILIRDYVPTVAGKRLRGYSVSDLYSDLDPSVLRKYQRIAHEGTRLYCEMHGKVSYPVRSTIPELYKYLCHNTRDMSPSEKFHAIGALAVLRELSPCLYVRHAILYHRNPTLRLCVQEIEYKAVTPVTYSDLSKSLEEISEHLLLSDQSQPKYHHQS